MALLLLAVAELDITSEMTLSSGDEMSDGRCSWLLLALVLSKRDRR